MSTTTAAIAKAAGIAPRTTQVIIRDEDGYAVCFDGSRTESVLVALRRPDITPGLDFPTRIAASAVYKCLTTGRMNPSLACRVQEYTPYQVCNLVAHIVNQVGEDQLLLHNVGPVADTWINQHRDEL